MTKSLKEITRRDFIHVGGTMAACSLIPAPIIKALAPPAPADIHFGYASITWDGKDRQAIEDISALGFPGIQLRANAIAEFENNPAALRELLDAHKLKMVALSSGNLDTENPPETEIAAHLARARFAKDAGAIYLQVIGARPKGRDPVRADYEKMGKLLTELSKRTLDIGVQVGFHNHMGFLAERPEEVDWIFESTDPRYAKLELDVAHCVQGGGDPVKMMTKYSDRLLFMHLKDVRPAPAPKNYQFVELGRGRVDFPAIFAGMDKIKYHGWAIVELDAVPDPAQTPKECAEISKKYLADKLGYKI
ncbi:MAG TPA: sugar phosphate isomerase/epimerase [Candidatus Acidoferrales bacterium]